MSKSEIFFLTILTIFLFVQAIFHHLEMREMIATIGTLSLSGYVDLNGGKK